MVKSVLPTGLAAKYPEIQPGLILVGVYGGKAMRGRALAGLEYRKCMELIKNKKMPGHPLKLQFADPNATAKKESAAAAVDVATLSPVDFCIYKKFQEFDDDNSVRHIVPRPLPFFLMPPRATHGVLCGRPRMRWLGLCSKHE